MHTLIWVVECKCHPFWPVTGSSYVFLLRLNMSQKLVQEQAVAFPAYCYKILVQEGPISLCDHLELRRMSSIMPVKALQKELFVWGPLRSIRSQDSKQL